MGTFNRRDFLKGIGLLGTAGAGAFAFSACTPKPSGSDSSDATGDAWDDSADLVIIGTGTGMGGALPALEAGKSVILLEKNMMVGGDWGINGGVVYAAGTKVQEAAGVVDERTGKPDNADSCYEDWLRDCNYVPDPAAVRRIVDGGADLIDYFTSLGVQFELYQSGSDPVMRGHTCHFGGTITSAVAADLESKGARILTSTRGDRVLLDERGQVMGVQAFDLSAKKTLRIAAKAVIVATGGAGRNNEMVARYNPEAAGLATPSGPWATGDGIRMIEEVRGAFWGYSPVKLSYLVYAGPNGESPQFETTPAFSKSGPQSYNYFDITVTRRFDEQAGGNGSAYLAYPYDNPPIPAYGIFDQAEFDDPGFTLFLSNGHDALGSLVEQGIIKKADTLEELAQALKISSAGLVAAVEKYNNGIDAGEDEFGRNIAWSRKIEKAPFYGWEGKPLGKDVNMSVQIDERCCVVDIDGNTIPGLYAAGNKLINQTVLGPSYPGSGAYVASGFVMSRIAGENAVQYMG